MEITESIINKFWLLVEKQEDGCWIWKGAKSGRGTYGYFSIKKKVLVRAHRFSYNIAFGEIPTDENGKSLYVCHKCDVRLCVNPDHLFLGTAYDNRRDCVIKNRDTTNFSGINRAKTHCNRGHKFDDENTLYSGKGRHCRACKRIRDALYRSRNKK